MTKNGLEYIDLTAKAEKSLTLVCVTDQMRCDRIIKAGKLLCDLTGTTLAVVNVARPGVEQDPQSIEYLFHVSSQNGAQMAVLYEEDVAKALIRYIKSHKVSYMLTGIPGERDSIIHKIWSRFTHVTIFVVEHDGELREVGNPAKAARQIRQASAVREGV